MRIRFVAIAGLLGGAIVGSVVGLGRGAAISGDCRPRLPAGSSVTAAIRGNRVVAVDDRAGPASRAPAGSALRHVATAPGRMALVRDQLGDDVVVVSTRRGTLELPQPGEAVHPAWSPAGALVWAVGDDVAILEPGATRPRPIQGPRPGGMLFGPVFAREHAVVVARSTPPTRLVPEDEWSNDLWRLDLRSGVWRRLTSFPADADRWTAIRTPVAVGNGVVEFVRVVGVASRTEPPRFELWRLVGGEVVRVRRLPGERYLAGVIEGDRIWNVPDHDAAAWRLIRERPDGRSIPLGCGALGVDPMDVTDPDRRAPAGANEPRPGEAEVPGGSTPAAILVGDFPDEGSAAEAAGEVASAYDPALVQVVGHRDQPTLVRPGSWAVVLRLGGVADPVLGLEAFRQRLPRWAEASWLVTP